MRELDELLDDICAKRAEYRKLIEQRDSMLNTTQNLALRDELTRTLQKYVDAIKQELKAAVAELVRWPPHKREHFDKLAQFFTEHDYARSVFIMTKFPENPPKSKPDQQLQKVINAVRDAVIACGFKPHLASDKRYHPEMFRNIEVYLMGCSRAIAIVESKHTKELNPNVTMEWGWLRATDREVLYLVEETFDRGRADISGLISDKFIWENPLPGVRAAVQGFLKN